MAAALLASAPGKAVLCGEYAVLAGAPGVCLALDRRARVSIEPQDADSSLAAPGYLEERLTFRGLPDGRIEWLDPLPADKDHALFAAVWETVMDEGGEALSITLDTRAFFDAAGGEKLGVGSSAALTTALTAGLCALRSRQGELRLAERAHRAFQSGRGSGIDIAAAFHGGVIRFQRGRPAEQLAWPAELSYRLFWSGQSAATADKLALHERSAAGDADTALAAASEAVIRAFDAGSATSVVDALEEYAIVLDRFDRAHGLGVFAAGHRDLAQLARGTPNLVYKPCGAGGGDVGVAVSTNAQTLAEFAHAAESRGFRGLDLAIDAHGVRVEDV